MPEYNACMLSCFSHAISSRPVDCSHPDSSVHGILQARILVWVAISFSRRPSWLRDRTQVSCTAGGFFIIWATWGATFNWRSIKSTVNLHVLDYSLQGLLNVLHASTPYQLRGLLYINIFQSVPMTSFPELFTIAICQSHNWINHLI